MEFPRGLAILPKIDLGMKDFFLSTTFAPRGSRLGEILELCFRYGFRHIELGSTHDYEGDPQAIVRCFQFEYLVHNYFPPPQESFILNIASLDETIYRRSINQIFRSIDFCDEIGARLYTFHPGFLTDPKGESQDPSNYDFKFSDERLAKADYQNAFQRMVEAISQIISYGQKRRVPIALETEGTFYRNRHLLMQKPEEYCNFFRYFSPQDIRINLNLGHLHLAASFFNFRVQDFVDLVANYVVAMEMSHSEGLRDEHRPLCEDGWYWDIITDPRFQRIYKILELRNTSIDEISQNARMIRHRLSKN